MPLNLEMALWPNEELFQDLQMALVHCVHPQHNVRCHLEAAGPPHTPHQPIRTMLQRFHRTSPPQTLPQRWARAASRGEWRFQPRNACKQANTKNNYTRLELAAASTRAAIFKRSRT